MMKFFATKRARRLAKNKAAAWIAGFEAMKKLDAKLTSEQVYKLLLTSELSISDTSASDLMTTLRFSERGLSLRSVLKHATVAAWMLSNPRLANERSQEAFEERHRLIGEIHDVIDQAVPGEI